MCHLPFQASGRSNSPFSHKGRRGQGDEGQKARECSKPRIAPKNAALGSSSPSVRLRHIRARLSSIPAPHGEARLHGLWRIIYSKTISPRLSKAKPACAGDSRQTFIRAYPSYPCQSVFSSGSSRRSPPARAIPDHYIQRPYQRNCTSYLCTRFAALCPQCVPWRDDGGCATWRCASLASFRTPA